MSNNWKDRFNEKFAKKEVGFSTDFGEYKEFEDAGFYDSVLDFIEDELNSVKNTALENQRWIYLTYESEIDAIANKSTAQLISWSEDRKLFKQNRTKDEDVQKLSTLASLGSNRLYVTKPCDYCEGMGTRTVSVEQDNGYGAIEQEECGKCKGKGVI